MKIKNDTNLWEVRCMMATSLSGEALGIDLGHALMDEGLLEGIEDEYGMYLGDIVEDTATEPDALEKFILRYSGMDKSGVTECPRELLHHFRNLIVLGDGDCPMCGGKLIYGDAYGRMEGGSYYSPPTFIVEGYLYMCTSCRQYIESDRKL